MANQDRKVRIQIDTTANPAGAEKAADALKRVADAQKDIAANPMTDGSQLSASPEKAEAVADAIREQAAATDDLSAAVADYSGEVAAVKQQEEDLAEARRLQSERQLEAVRKNADAEVKAAQDAKVSLAAKAGAIAAVVAVWNTATGAVREQIAELRKVSPAAAEQFSAIEAGLEALENPLRAALIPAIKEAQTEIGLLKQALVNAEQAEAKYQQARRDQITKTESALVKRVEGTLKRELQIIEDQNAAYDRQKGIIDAIRSLEESRAKISDANRIANGADPVAVKAEAQARQVQTESAGVDQTISDAEQRFNRAAEAAQSAIDALAGIANLSEEEANRASQRAEDAVRARDQAQLDLEAVRQTAEIQKQQILTEAIGGIQGIAAEVGPGVTDAANQAIGIIEAKAKEQGGKLSADAKAVLDGLYEMVRNSIPDQQEAGKLESLLSQFRVSTEARDRSIYRGITGLMDYAAAQERKFELLQRQISELQRQSAPMAPMNPR